MIVYIFNKPQAVVSLGLKVLSLRREHFCKPNSQMENKVSPLLCTPCFSNHKPSLLRSKRKYKVKSKRREKKGRLRCLPAMLRKNQKKEKKIILTSLLSLQ